MSYLNTVPLVEFLPSLLPDVELCFDHPSRLADGLASGRFDIALAPCVELARHPQWSIISNACIGCRGPVLSVKVLFRRPPEEVRTLALDEGSRSSAVLAQILLHDLHGVEPKLELLPINALPEDSAADAVLVIGDRAIRTVQDGFATAWDLGDRWCRRTELPFVFAAWAARPGVGAPEIEAALEEARDRGCQQIEMLARKHAKKMALPYPLVLNYLRDHLNFTLGEHERLGLEMFFQRAAAIGLIPSHSRLRFDDCPA